jgi:hypothetical protein
MAIQYGPGPKYGAGRWALGAGSDPATAAALGLGLLGLLRAVCCAPALPAPIPFEQIKHQTQTRLPALGLLPLEFCYGWTGRKSSSGFSDRPPAALGVFASLDRF